VLERSALYSTILKQQMDDARARHAEERRVASQKQISKKQSPKKRGKGRPAKRHRTVEDSDDEESSSSLPLQSASNEAGEDAKEEPAFPQPALVSGATLKDYQLEGLQWMVGLHEQGISGILGAFLAFFSLLRSSILFLFGIFGALCRGKAVGLVEAFFFVGELYACAF
jgi:ATP-dependent DNA helicase